MIESVPMHIHMNGSEWFNTRAGGLNRYFDSLYLALKAQESLPEFRVSASAFGDPLPGGTSWGAHDASLPARYARAMKSPAWSPSLVIDRHFSLYGGRPHSQSFRAPLVVHFHGPWAGESRAAGQRGLSVALKRSFEKFRYRNADAYVVLSEGFKDLLSNEYGVDAHKVQVIPPGVDLKKFRPAQHVPTRPNIVCVRRLERRMGIDVLLRAWSAVIAKCPEAHLTVVGTGTEERSLRDLAQSLSLSSSVSFAGRASDEQLARLYAESSATVVPSLELEGFGLIALESLAAGRAPIVTNVGGLPDAVRGLDQTLILERGDVAALADRILDAFDGKVPSPASCRSHAESFSWAEAANRHLDVYRSVL